MAETPVYREPRIVSAGFWLTKRRGILLSPLFAVALLAARKAPSLRIEVLQDTTGLLCLLGGAWLRLVAASYHDTSHQWEPITAGPYAWVRHPLYLANFLIGLGIMLFAGWWPMVAVYVFLFLPLHLLIARAEEIHLKELYGEKYEVYRRAVAAILPWRPFPGRRYGIRNEFKLRKGHERLKVTGYLFGMAGILLFKQFRYLLKPPSPHPISFLTWAVGLLLVALMVAFRGKTRSSLIRSFQTALSTAIILFLAMHLAGVWPAPPTQTSAPSGRPLYQKESTEQSPRNRLL